MPVEIEVYKAQRFTQSDDECPNATLIMKEEIPNFKTPEATNIQFVGNATAIENVLWNTLPGGTYDRLLGLMLKRRASHFVIAHGEQDAS